MKRLLVTMLIAVGIAAGCGGGGGENGEPAAATQDPPRAFHTVQPDHPLPPGRYVTQRFVPNVAFTIGEGWRPMGPELVDIFDLGKQDYPEPKLVTFMRPEIVYAPDKPWDDPDALQPAPEDIVDWLRTHPHLTTSEPQPRTVGAAEGVEFDVEVSSLPTEQFPQCPRPCVLLFQISDGQIAPLQGEKGRFIVVDVDGRTVLIFIEAPPPDWAAFSAEAEELLSSVEFQ